MCDAPKWLFGALRCAGGCPAHVGKAFELDGISGSDQYQAWAEPNGWQCPGLDLLVHLFADNEPVLRQLGDGHVRLRMRLQVFYAHVTAMD